ncbi:PsbP-related protein [Treponema denticola]|uniref:Uncharacterized protein n=1 Tax=Treponema denticola SP33 TaxID=999437 RepID=M2ATB2_TREDN|nr:PsbP-related protein [Treponema denticola]EMB26591.1 hypothetical protein HMPREF9733_00462 [Treponema denticola SP33]EPF37407.1 hypothetical protein HMPREF9732_01441 [Treponema denticola SP32]
MKKKLSILFFIFILISYLSSQDYYIDDFKDFTFEMPDGWETMTYPGLKYKIIYGDSVKGQNQNMIFVSEEVSGSMEEVVSEYLSGQKNPNDPSPDSTVITQEKFENNYNLESRKIIMELHEEKGIVKHYFYLFKHNNILYVCAATLSHDAEPEIAEMLDAAMKTFQVLDKKEEE